MGKVVLEIETKRPDWATPERLLMLRESGVSVAELAQQCGVIPAMIYRLLQRAKKNRAFVGAAALTPPQKGA
mgnify:CR=1 FL=1